MSYPTHATEISPETGFGSWHESASPEYCIRGAHEVEAGTTIRFTNNYGEEHRECQPCVHADTARYFSARHNMKGGTW